jgi:hypothetical protein
MKMVMEKMRLYKKIIGITLVLLLIAPLGLGLFTNAQADEGGDEGTSQAQALQTIIEKLSQRIEELEEKGYNVTGLKALLQQAEEEISSGNITEARATIIQVVRGIALTISRQHKNMTETQRINTSQLLTEKIEGIINRVRSNPHIPEEVKERIVEHLETALDKARNGDVSSALRTVSEAMREYNHQVSIAKRNRMLGMLHAKLQRMKQEINTTNVTTIPLPPGILKNLEKRSNNILDLVKQYKSLRMMVQLRKHKEREIEKQLKESGVNQSLWKSPEWEKWRRKHEAIVGATPFFVPQMLALRAKMMLETMQWGHFAEEQRKQLMNLTNRTITIIDEAQEAYLSIANGSDVVGGFTMLNQTGAQAQELMEEISGTEARGPLMAVKRLLISSPSILEKEIDHMVISFNKIMSKENIVIKGIIVDVESNTSFVVWGTPYGFGHILTNRTRAMPIQVPVWITPVNWKVIILSNTTILGEISEGSPAIVFGHPIQENEGQLVINATKVLVYPFVHMEENETETSVE